MKAGINVILFYTNPTGKERFYNLTAVFREVKTRRRYRTVEDFLVSHPLTIDVEIEDEWSGSFPVKGIELQATVLYAELADYYRYSFSLQPGEMLIYVNNFLAWMTRAAETVNCSVLHRELDHAVLLVFSEKLGSSDPFADALRVARWMGEHDVFRFGPRVGLASGSVTAGFTGTPGKFGASVLGQPVVRAAAFAGSKPQGDFAMRITVADDEWGEKTLKEMFPPAEYDDPEQGKVKEPQTWELGKSRVVDFAFAERAAVRDIVSFIHWMPERAADNKAREWFGEIKRQGFYRNPSAR